jgi:hypothetical protein
MLDITKIRFCELDFDYDQDAVRQEVERLDLKPLRPGRGIVEDQRRMDLFTEEQIELSCVKRLDYHIGYVGCSLTHLIDVEESILGGSGIRGKDPKAIWSWREDIDVPYIKSIIEQLKFIRLQTVRILLMKENTLGLIHNDDPDGKYYKNYGFSLTLNVSSGGTNMSFLEGEKRYDTNPGKSFIFRDDCWHGVPIAKSTRIQIRVNGIPDRKHIAKLVKQDSIVWMTN